MRGLVVAEVEGPSPEGRTAGVHQGGSGGQPMQPEITLSLSESKARGAT